MCFTEDLVKYDLTGKLNFYPVVSLMNSDNWKFGHGAINEEMIENHMPSPRGYL